MAYAKASLIQDIRHLLQDEPWETTSTTTLASGTVAVPDGTKWAAGDIGEWQTGTVGGEQFLVQSISGNTLTVARGYNGTTAETHTSGDRVVKNPRYSYIHIVEAIDKVINALYPTLWTQTSESITPDTTSTYFDSGLSATQAANVIDLIGGEQQYGTGQVGTFGYRVPEIASKKLVMVRNLPTALVTSGVGLRFPEGFYHTSNAVNVRFRLRISTTVTGSNYDDVDEGLLSDAIAYGVAARLVGLKEIPNLSEDQDVGEIGAGAFLNASFSFDLLFKEKVALYKDWLERSYPRLPDQNYIPSWW